MKNKLNVILTVLAVLNGFYPLLTLISHLFGYNVYIPFAFTYSLWLAVIFMYSDYFIKKNEKAESSKTAVILAPFLPAITAVNLAVLLFSEKSPIITLVMGICLIFAAVIAEKILKGTKTKVLSVISSALICLFVLIYSFVTIFSSLFGVRTVKSVINSPQRTYCAEVVDIDQGALGGDTVVYVYRSRNIRMGLIGISKKPQKIYTGDWGEYKTMQLEWKDEKTLVIDGKEYSINI